MTSIHAELLYTPDCPHADRAERALRWVLTSENVEADIVRVRVADLDQAAGVDFHGSPTIRLDGVDVVPVEEGAPVNLACRLYRDGNGRIDGVPPEDVIRSAIE